MDEPVDSGDGDARQLHADAGEGDLLAGEGDAGSGECGLLRYPQERLAAADRREGGVSGEVEVLVEEVARERFGDHGDVGGEEQAPAARNFGHVGGRAELERQAARVLVPGRETAA